MGTQSVSVDTIPMTFVAARTWVEDSDPAGWALVIRRYQYPVLPNGGACITTGPCSFFFPGAPSSTDYFVPTAMKIMQTAGHTDAANTYVLVTGYSPAPSFGNTDYRTVCFNGNLVLRWDQKYSLELTFDPAFSGPDEYPVDISVSSLGIATVTGNTHNGLDWDVQSLIYKVDNGKLLHAAVEASANPPGNDFAAGCRAFGSPTATSWHYIVATMNDSTLGNSLAAFRYEQLSGGPFTKTSRTYSQAGGTVRANAMDGFHSDGLIRDLAVGVGKVSGIDASQMLMVKFDFHTGAPGWNAMFSALPPTNTQNEALAVKYYPTINDNGSVGDLFAMAGYGLRDSAHGLDPLACLYEETGPSTPTLRWSAWLNRFDTPVDVFDTCTGLDMDENPPYVNELERGYHVYVIGQRPLTTTEIDWRVAVYTSAVTVPPTDPTLKGTSGAPLQVSGTSVGTDVPLKMGLVIDSFAAPHEFVVSGNVYNGPVNGDDIAAHLYRYFPVP